MTYQPNNHLTPPHTTITISSNTNEQVEDVARAFEVILHNGVTGKIYNIGGTHEKANIEVAKDLIRLMGKGEEEVRGGLLLGDDRIHIRGGWGDWL